MQNKMGENKIWGNKRINIKATHGKENGWKPLGNLAHKYVDFYLWNPHRLYYLKAWESMSECKKKLTDTMQPTPSFHDNFSGYIKWTMSLNIFYEQRNLEALNLKTRDENTI